MKPTLRAGILTIGTEISNGQIVNSNAAWIANQLIDVRIEPAFHLSVADIRSDIKDALDLLRTRCSVLIVTGGLGPTTDDITRDVVSEWAGDKLVFDEGAWKHIEDRFATMGITPPESNRQQCFFPSRARILQNRKGTAHGFRLATAEQLLFCLPGPPEEIQVIWKDHIALELRGLGAESEKPRLFRWHCLGLSESGLGEIVEDIIRGSSLTSGYRPHLPYVEVKIWCNESRLAEEQYRIDRLDAALSRWTLAKGDEDSLDRLILEMQSYRSIFIDDGASAGTLAARLGKKWQPHFPPLTIIDRWRDESVKVSPIGPDSLELKVSPLAEDGSWHVVWKTSDVQKSQSLRLPYKRHPQRMDRERLFVCEMTIAAWTRSIPEGDLLA
jgi:molybdenum cofactor synthesis domain-containing protein